MTKGRHHVAALLVGALLLTPAAATACEFLCPAGHVDPASGDATASCHEPAAPPAGDALIPSAVDRCDHGSTPTSATVTSRAAARSRADAIVWSLVVPADPGLTRVFRGSPAAHGPPVLLSALRSSVLRI